MDWAWLSFLAEPVFVVPWYVVGMVGAFWVAADVRGANTPLKPAMKWAWPIIVLFFSVLGLALYVATARAPGIGHAEAGEKAKLHAAYERATWRRVNGAVIHCVAGDGLGIMTAMVVARVSGMTFWQEFWFEYAVGFAFGWLVFQYKSMTMMARGPGHALWLAFRAEFFSMLTVMGGMGAVMTYVTPMVVGAQPGPLTFGFWGFGMLGLLVGYVFTWPMNWMLVKLGWKHGMGPMHDARPARRPFARRALGAAMALLGAAALVLPAWLTERRTGAHVEGGADVAAEAVPRTVERGLEGSLHAAASALGAGRRSEATVALDAAMRAAEVAAQALPEGGRPALDDIRRARRALQNGRPADAPPAITAAIDAARALGAEPAPPPAHIRGYNGVPLINAQGVVVGEVELDEEGALRLALGGARDVWGFWDLGARQVAWLPAQALVFGPRHTIGKSFVMLPTLETPPLPVASIAPLTEPSSGR